MAVGPESKKLSTTAGALKRGRVHPYPDRQAPTATVTPGEANWLHPSQASRV
jgi:hypothetical protein